MRALLPLLCLSLTACFSTPDKDDTGQPASDVTLEDVATEDADGAPILDGQTVTVSGVATVAAGVLGGRKLRIHLQDAGFGCAIDADEVVSAELAEALGGILEGDELRITGLVTQEDLPSNDAPGTFDGLTRIRVEDSTRVERLSSGNDLPDPLPLTLAEIIADGDSWEGILVQVEAVHKHADHADLWVTSLDSSTTIDVYDDAETGPMKVRLGNGEHTGGYGDDPGLDSFDLVGLLREDQTIAPETDAGGSSFELWPRGERDILRSR
jgi:hypothetical protein